MDEKLYYVQDARQVVGNCVLWWCAGGQGYTTQIDDAGRYTRADVLEMRDTDRAWPVEVVDAIVVRHVRQEALQRSTAGGLGRSVEIAPRDWLAVLDGRADAT